MIINSLSNVVRILAIDVVFSKHVAGVAFRRVLVNRNLYSAFNLLTVY